MSCVSIFRRVERGAVCLFKNWRFLLPSSSARARQRRSVRRESLAPRKSCVRVGVVVLDEERALVDGFGGLGVALDFGEVETPVTCRPTTGTQMCVPFSLATRWFFFPVYLRYGRWIVFWEEPQDARFIRSSPSIVTRASYTSLYTHSRNFKSEFQIAACRWTLPGAHGVDLYPPKGRDLRFVRYSELGFVSRQLEIWKTIQSSNGTRARSRRLSSTHSIAHSRASYTPVSTPLPRNPNVESTKNRSSRAPTVER